MKRRKQPRNRRTSTATRLTLCGLLIAYAVLVAAVAWRNAPVPDETAHLDSGLAIWRNGSFEHYPVNPPLVRMIASAPVSLMKPAADSIYHRRYRPPSGTDARPEWGLGIVFVRANRDHAQWYFAVARWACIPFGLIGAYFCWRWADELYGGLAGVLACVLWCFEPNIITWSATICPDAAGAALGVAASYFFWRWLREPEWANVLTAGVVLGLTQLVKMTWVILFGLWPVIWLIWVMGRPRESANLRIRHKGFQLLSILTLAALVLNTGYGFEGSFTKLGDFNFVSHSLAGKESVLEGGPGGNRFAETWLADMPVPVPYHYLRGMDLQKYDFERGMPSYLCGRWNDRGWWYYYLVCSAIKVPLGIWCLAFLALAVSLRGRLLKTSHSPLRDPSRDASSVATYSWRDEMVLLLPAIVLFVFVSSQTGLSRHFRYVLPVFPFVFIWASQLAPAAIRYPRTIGVLVTGFLTWSIASSLWIYPHSMSYFNELVGGPRHGHKYLLDSNFDWGQDAFYLREWLQQHHEAAPLNILSANSYASDLIDSNGDPAEDSSGLLAPGSGFVLPNAAWKTCPMPGWFAVSMRRVHDAGGDYSYFLRLKPVAAVGYGFNVFHVTWREANRVRHELELPVLPNHWQHGGGSEAIDDSTRAFVASIAKRAHRDEVEGHLIRVALFRRNARNGNESSSLTRVLNATSNLEWSYVSADDIRSRVLKECDVVLFPGGSGSEMGEALDEQGRLAVREFVNRGGGYIGICGGAFLATAKYDWSLGLVNARTLTGTITVPGHGDKSMVARGVDDVKIGLTSPGRDLFGAHADTLKAKYSGGPILSPADIADLPPYAPLAIYRTEIWLYEQQRGTMVGTPAIVAAPFGKGRVILFSPHPESSKGLEDFVTIAVRAVAP